MSGPRPPIERVAVVVPVHNEEQSLPACLTALARTVDELAREIPGVHPHILVVLDTCTDASARIVQSFMAGAGDEDSYDVQAIEITSGRVGRTRALGIDAALATMSADTQTLASIWIASTDADTVVPPHWLTAQLLHADAGTDVLLGTVEPDATLEAPQRAAWLARHQLEEGHPHVHGANLGIRASTYRAVGGFAPLPQHEDVDLVTRLSELPGTVITATDTTRVVTSSRRTGRALDGFATYLTMLDETVG